MSSNSGARRGHETGEPPLGAVEVLLIVSSNLDEFFEVRVAASSSRCNEVGERSVDGLTPPVLPVSTSRPSHGAGSKPC